MTYDNPNFNKKTLDIINTYEPLADWFDRNDDAITYYEFCLDNSMDAYKYRFDKEYRDQYRFYNQSLLIVKEMVDSCILWFNTKYNYTDYEKALKAACAIKKLYDANLTNISDALKDRVYIDVAEITPEFANDALNPPDINDLRFRYLNDVKVAKIIERDKLEEQKQQLQEEIDSLDEAIKRCQDSSIKTY